MIRVKILDYLTTTEVHKIGILYIVLAVINLMPLDVSSYIPVEPRGDVLGRRG